MWLITVGTVAMHVVLAAVLGSMGVSVLLNMVHQVASGYTRSGYFLVGYLAMVPAVLAVAIVVGIVAWLRKGRSRIVLVADLTAWATAWTVLVPLVFLPDDRMLITLVLAPACSLVMAIQAYRASPRRSRASGDATRSS